LTYRYISVSKIHMKIGCNVRAVSASWVVSWTSVLSSTPEIKLKVILRLTVIRQVYPGIRPPSGPPGPISISITWRLSLDICVFLLWGDLTDKGWVCNLQLRLVIASAVFLEFQCCWTHDHILFSKFWDSFNLKDQGPLLFLPGAVSPSYTPGHWVNTWLWSEGNWNWRVSWRVLVSSDEMMRDCFATITEVLLQLL
jgi:hypothetical protein